MIRCKDCRYGCAKGECARENVDMSKQMFFTMLPLMLICFIVFLYYMISITRVEIHGVNKLTPDYFETNQHCRR